MFFEYALADYTFLLRRAFNLRRPISISYPWTKAGPVTPSYDSMVGAGTHLEHENRLVGRGCGVAVRLVA